jgi:hypothetical protein
MKAPLTDLELKSLLEIYQDEKEGFEKCMSEIKI